MPDNLQQGEANGVGQEGFTPRAKSALLAASESGDPTCQLTFE
jgi:hypothetical protein